MVEGTARRGIERRPVPAQGQNFGQEALSERPDYSSQKYTEFTPEKLTTNPDERVQIAYRLAQRLGQKTVYSIDEQSDTIDYFPFDKVQAYAKTHHQTPASMTKRYFTSPFTTRSQASLISWMDVISTSGMTPCGAQKSSISCVSLIPPMPEPASERRCMRRLKIYGEFDGRRRKQPAEDPTSVHFATCQCLDAIPTDPEPFEFTQA